jgi:hypothetical protein
LVKLFLDGLAPTIASAVLGRAARFVLGSLAAGRGVRCLAARLVLGSLSAGRGVRCLAARLVLGSLSASVGVRGLPAGSILGRAAILAFQASNLLGIPAGSWRATSKTPEDARHGQPSLDPDGVRHGEIYGVITTRPNALRLSM